MDTPGYVLGHSAFEIERLTVQARLVDPITRGYLLSAGLAPGMTVLDIGSGAGDVAFLAAAIVGVSGEVLGTDLSPAAVAAATTRARTRGNDNVSFLAVDPAKHDFGRSFDAIIGRYVLMFIPDPVAALAGICRNLAPGGIVSFHEPHWPPACSLPRAPLFEACYQWVESALRLSGGDTRMGMKLYPTFIAAGLPPPTLGFCATTGGGADADDQLHLVADLAVTLMPAFERHGIAEADEVGIDTLFARMRADVLAKGSVVVGRSEMGAWTRVGGRPS